MNARLHMVMRALSVSGRELSEAIHVDSSLISKWRTGTRTLSHSSPHLQKVVEFLIAKDLILGKGVITNLVARCDPTANLKDLSALQAGLSKWLADPEYFITKDNESAIALEQENGAYNVGFRVYRGDSGRRLAVLAFLDYVLLAPRGQQLLLLSQEDMSWLVEDKAFLHLWQTKLMEVIQLQHKIQIIHWVDRDGANLAAILYRWLPLYLVGGIEGWYVPEYVQPMVSSTLFIMEQAMAVWGMTADDPAKNRYTALVTDPISVSQAEWLFGQWLEKCQPLVDLHPKSELPRIIKSHLTAEQSSQVTCLKLEIPLFTSMSRELLLSILEENGVEDFTIQECLMAYDRFRGHDYHSVRQIISLSALERALTSESIYNHELSKIAGKDIVISQQAFRAHLHDFLELHRANPQRQLALKTDTTPALDDVTINIWLAHPNTVMAWSPHLPLLAATHEYTLIHAFLQNFELQWNAIPRINRNKEWVTAQIEALLGDYDLFRTHS